jgi:hypothetical protein
MFQIAAVFIFPIVIAVVICKGIMFLMERAMIFSKVVVALFFALIVNTKYSIVESSGLLSYLAWSGIFLAATFVLCLLPRINCAYQFLCNSLVSYFLAVMIYGIACTSEYQDSFSRNVSASF